MTDRKRPEKPNRNPKRIMWELPRVIVKIDPPLNEGITCRAAEGVCKNTKKCNRKNACNESLREFF
jgi:hypothetical protein